MGDMTLSGGRPFRGCRPLNMGFGCRFRSKGGNCGHSQKVDPQECESSLLSRAKKKKVNPKKCPSLKKRKISRRGNKKVKSFNSTILLLYTLNYETETAPLNHPLNHTLKITPKTREVFDHTPLE